MKKNLLFVALIVFAIFGTTAQAQTVATFDNLALPVDSFWNGSDLSGSFNSGNAVFYNSYNTQYGSWSGFAYSTKKDSVTPGYANMYSSANGKGYNNSDAYAVAYVNSYSVTALALTASAKGKIVDGFYINNNTYAYQSMLNGDAYAKKFTSHDSDWFMLRTYGYLNGSLTDSVDFYLADFRFADSSKAYILKSWKWLDLTSLGNIDSITFALSSSDVGSWGMNTPAYFCMDNFTTKDGVGFEQITVHNHIKLYPNPVIDQLNIDLDQLKAHSLQIYDANGRLLSERINPSIHTKIDVSMLQNGIYFMQIVTDNAVITKKFIKQ